jgi:hypothetical protein
MLVLRNRILLLIDQDPLLHLHLLWLTTLLMMVTSHILMSLFLDLHLLSSSHLLLLLLSAHLSQCPLLRQSQPRQYHRSTTMPLIKVVRTILQELYHHPRIFAARN